MASLLSVGALLILAPGFSYVCASTDVEGHANSSDQAWEILHTGLRDEKPSRRVEAVKALSLIQGDRQAIRFALGALHDKEARVRIVAAVSLGQLHATSAIPQLREALSDKEISVVLAAAFALSLLKDKTAYGVYYAILMGDKKTSEGMIQAQLDRLKDPKQVTIIGIEEGLGFVPFAGMGVAAVRTIKKDDTSPARAAAARLLAHDPDPLAEDALMQTALADNNDFVRQAALDALAERGNPACAERLMKNLDESKSAIRYRTAATIIRLSRARPKAKSKK